MSAPGPPPAPRIYPPGPDDFAHPSFTSDCGCSRPLLCHLAAALGCLFTYHRGEWAGGSVQGLQVRARPPSAPEDSFQGSGLGGHVVKGEGSWWVRGLDGLPAVLSWLLLCSPSHGLKPDDALKGPWGKRSGVWTQVCRGRASPSRLTGPRRLRPAALMPPPVSLGLLPSELLRDGGGRPPFRVPLGPPDPCRGG